MLSATLFVGVDDLMANGLHDRRDIPIIPKNRRKKHIYIDYKYVTKHKSKYFF